MKQPIVIDLNGAEFEYKTFTKRMMTRALADGMMSMIYAGLAVINALEGNRGWTLVWLGTLLVFTILTTRNLLMEAKNKRSEMLGMLYIMIGKSDTYSAVHVAVREEK